MNEFDSGKCILCPRECEANRNEGEGCGKLKIAKTMLHRFEEPIISGTRGSGAIFFAGCNLGCSFCQNAKISRKPSTDEDSCVQLEQAMLELGEKAENINLVTAAHVLPWVVKALRQVKGRLKVPIVYNSGGYEKASAIKMLDGLVDVYLPDLKFYSPQISAKYCNAPDYFQAAVKAIDEMVRQQSKVEIQDGLIKKGVVIRHLVMPSCRADSLEIAEQIASRWKGKVLVSIMSQYTPDFNNSQDKALDRRLTKFEYNSVVSRVQSLGLDGFMQSLGSASKEYTPEF